MNVQLVDELREVADWFRLRGLDENAALLDHAAHVVQCAANFAIFKPSRAGSSDVTEEQVLERINRAKEDQIMSKYTAAQIKNWDVDTEAPTVGWIPARPINHTGIITRCRHALGVLTGRYDVLDWEQEARAAIAKATVEVK